MASSSTSSIPKSFTYDVFLSFRGVDTRKNFVDHLYHALQHKSINTFKDDKNMEKGERISTELIKAIEDSRFHIIVFSKNYASSSWCLDELVKIMECQKTTEHTAYPVFYDVEPTEVRKQAGAVGEAFSKHRNEVDAEKWREALKEAADLSSWVLKNFADGHEFPFIQTIVEEISQKLPFINSSVDENLVGMETRVDNIVSSLETSAVDDIRMIGIKGIGGGGKTTLARALFDQISSQFKGKSFVENVREVSKPDLSGLKLLQEQVLRDVLNEKDVIVSGIHDGKTKMKNMMSGRKVLLVLDDVDHIDQLAVLAGKNWFGPGSRIIITTRDAQVLIAHEVNSIHDVNLLSNEEAICLFNKFAFRTGEIPIPRFKLELSQQVARYADGLPLTIRVLGAHLKDKDASEWKDILERLKKFPLEETLQKLELSYISLDEEQKKIFLDVACFWKGERKEEAIRALESCQLHAIAGLRVLERKSLMTISRLGCLDMHDHIQEMGRDIVRRLHPDEPYRHSRLWIDEETEDILANDLGSEETRGIKLWSSKLHPSIIMKGLNNMKKLRFLHVTTTHRNFCMNSNDCSHIQYFPNTLQYLYWTNYPFSSLSITTSRGNLLQGGEGKVLKKLRFLCISFSSCLKTLDLGFTPNLETLSIRNCFYFNKLHMPTECLKFKSLDISNSKLTTLDLGFTPNLETLSLEECDHLVELQMPTKCLKLKSFEVKGSTLTTLDLEGTSNLETLSLGRCFHLVELQMPAKCLKLVSLEIWYCSKLMTLDLRGAPNLETLTVDECDHLVELQMPAKCLKLKSFVVKGLALTTLDLEGTSNLETLSLGGCFHLVELHMPAKCLNLNSLDINRSKLTTLYLEGTPKLETLSLKYCDDLEELQMLATCLKLKSLDIEGSKLTSLNLEGTPNLEMVCLKCCAHLVELHMPVGYEKLTLIHIIDSKLRTLDLGGTPNLEMLRLHACDDLVELKMPIRYLKLKSLAIWGSKLATLELRGTPNLKTLFLQECHDLVELYLLLEYLKLDVLRITGSKLRTLDFRQILNLRQLCLVYCVDLLELHMPVESRKLELLKICGSKLTTLDLRQTLNLRQLCLVDCVDLLELHMPVEFRKLELLKICRSKLRTLDLRQTSNLGHSRLEVKVDLVKLDINIKGSKLRTLDLRFLWNLEILSLSGCYDLVELNMHGGGRKLRSLNLSDSNSRFMTYLFRKILLLPPRIGMDAHDTSIYWPPNDLYQLQRLEELTLLSLDIEHLPNDICILKHLKSLKLESCRLLVKITEDLGRLECLERLILSECGFLQDIPNSICKMKRLQCISLRNCFLIEKLPEELGQLECLEELNIEGTCISNLPQSIFVLKHGRLRIVGSRLLLQSCGFTSEIQTSEDETFCYV